MGHGWGHHTDSVGGAGGWSRGFGPGFGGAGGRGRSGPPPWLADLFGMGAPPQRGPRVRRGDVRAAILSVLAEAGAEEEINGYGVIQAIGDRSGGAWRPSPGSVYPTLQQLVDEELIEAVGEGRRTEYALTEAGRAYVKENAEELTRAWESGAPKRSEQERAFHESVGKLMGVVGQFHHAASDAQRAAASEKLDEVRRALYLILAD